MMVIRGKKGDVTWDHVIPWLLGLLVLVLIIFLYMALNDKATGAGQMLKNLLRFGT